MTNVAIPKNTRLIGKITATFPDGRRFVIEHFRSRVRPVEWIAQAIFEDGRRTGRLAEQFSGKRLETVPAEIAASLDILREAGATIDA